MRAAISSTLVLLGLALVAGPELGRAQSDREFVFADEDGHLLVRFPGSESAGLDSSQATEISNAEFSSMVHDRLRADLLFEAEPTDPDWANSMEPRIEQHVARIDLELSRVSVACRAASCRVVLEQPRHWTVPEHRAVLETAQESIEDFIAAHGEHFEPVFMITAYDQERETPHIKVFLRRTERSHPTDPPAR